MESKLSYYTGTTENIFTYAEPEATSSNYHFFKEQTTLIMCGLHHNFFSQKYVWKVSILKQFKQTCYRARIDLQHL